MRDEFNSASRTSQYPLRVMRLRRPDGFVLTVGALQSRETAEEILDERKRRPTPLTMTLVRSDGVVRPSDQLPGGIRDASVNAPDAGRLG